MTMSRYLLSRAIWICAACLCCALVVALWLAARAIGDERRGAHAMAQLIPRLSALQTAAPAEREAHLAALRTINASAQMRHLWLHLEDATGQVLVSEAQPRDSSPLGGLLALPGLGADAARLESSWQIHTRDGATYRAALRWNPESEIREASGDMAGTLVVLVVYGALLLLGIHWALGQALAPLQQILAAIRGYEDKDYSVRLAPMRTREMDQLRRALNHLAGTLDETQAERRALSRKLLTAQESERARLARELHDEFGQVLTAMRADAAYLVRKSAHEPVLQLVANDLAGHCARIQHEVRHLLHRLRPHGVQPDGRLASVERLLQDLVQAWRDQPGQQVQVDYAVALGGVAPGPDLILTLYRMTQEALTNVMRHAGARRVAIRIAATAAGQAVRWSVEDDGQGIADVAAALQRSHGLRGMQERAWAHLGTLHIEPACAVARAAPGCRLSASFPLVPQAFAKPVQSVQPVQPHGSQSE
ncbi:histidine kinase [Cupriavidus basilensis]|uniref:histidine kinase n=1 Tax=Cupriavidus basilensis TaxID=68895 RepID=UPI0020A654CB|nr:histidine kinase [Cupriavidus basilensis]MCP3023154.1 histidine kinase [Cupriavidus basilensis]